MRKNRNFLRETDFLLREAFDVQSSPQMFIKAIYKVSKKVRKFCPYFMFPISIKSMDFKTFSFFWQHMFFSNGSR